MMGRPSRTLTASRRPVIRHALRSFRLQTHHAARFASRLRRVGVYGFNLLLWSRLVDRRLDAVPIELARTLLDKKGVRYSAPSLGVAGVEANRAAVWEEGFAGVYATLLLNLQTPDTLSPVRYAHPAPSFAGVYLWDSAFISQVWAPWDRMVARDVLQAVVDLRDGDRLQHVVADFSESVFTQPPLLAWAVHRLAQAQEIRDDAGWLGAMYEPLAAYHEWLKANRRLEGGLYAWLHPYESGIDNSPRFSTLDESRFADTTPLAAPDFATYMVLQCEALAELSDLLDREDAPTYRQAAQGLRDGMNDRLWHAGDGVYYDRNETSGEFVRSKTIASLLPLWAGAPTDAIANRLRDQAMDPDAFGTTVPLPTVARNDPFFAKDMWRGPVWINTAYAVLQGLARHGYLEETASLAYRLCDGVYRTFGECRRFFEFYDPDRYDIEELGRKAGNRWKHFTLGSKPVGEFVGWTGLVNTIVIETLVGFHHVAGRRVLRPLLPKEAEGVAMNVRLPQEGLDIMVEREGDRVLATVRSLGLTQRLEIGFGETVNIDIPAGEETAL